MQNIFLYNSSELYKEFGIITLRIVTPDAVTYFIVWYKNHWGRVMHTCVSNLTIIGSDNGLLPDRHQTIIWTNAGILDYWQKMSVES